VTVNKTNDFAARAFLISKVATLWRTTCSGTWNDYKLQRWRNGI